MGGNWTTISQAGNGTAPTVPNAPNVLNTTGHPTTLTVVYDCPNNDSVYAFQASISLDLTNPDIGHLREIHLMDSATGREVLGSPIHQPSGGWWTSPITFQSENYLQPTTARSGGIVFEAENDNGIISPAPVSVGYTVQASKVNSITASDSGTRAAGDNRLPYGVVNHTPVLNGNQVPQNVTLWFPLATDPTKYQSVGWQKMTSVGQVMTESRLIPAANTTWKIYAMAGAISADGNKLYTDADLVALGATPSGTFTMAGIAPPQPNVVTGITVGSIIAMMDRTSGWQWAELASLSWVDPTDASWLVKFYVRETDSAGNAAPDAKGLWREWLESQILNPGGQTRKASPDVYGGVLQIAYRAASDTHHYLQIQCVAVNRLSTSPSDLLAPTRPAALHKEARSSSTLARFRPGRCR